MPSTHGLIQAGAIGLILSQTTSALEHLQNTFAASSSNAYCDVLCQQIQDPHHVGSIGGTIENIVSQGDYGILHGNWIQGCGYESSAIWNIWANGFQGSFPSGLHTGGSSGGGAEDRICLDKVTLARLTAAASQCLSQVHGSGGHSSGSYNAGWGGSVGPGTNPPPEDDTTHGNIGGLTGSGGSSDSHVNTGGSSSSSGGKIDIGGGVSGGGSTSSGSTSSGSTSTGWATGSTDGSICFKIKDKSSDRYLTTYGSEYAFAYYPNYYSVFRARPAKSVENGYTLYEVNRNGGVVNYPVKINNALNSFKPLNGDKDAIWTFSPAHFGDSCWGVPGKKMARRHDWPGWNDNYRFASSGEDCADVELEEAAC